MEGTDFRIYERTDESAADDNFPLHEHNFYEILFFLEGDSRFVIEGKNYFLESGDVMIVHKHEMHRVRHNSGARYRRVVLWVKPEFFTNHNCPDYESLFSNSQMRIGSRIKSEYVRSCGLYDAFMRIKKYSNNYTLESEPVVESIIMEILYLINRSGRFSSFDIQNEQVEKIISYINNHFTEDIDLDTLEQRFFLSKSYLCKIFRKATGLTIHDYINRKRLANVLELRGAGKSIGNAAILSGFNDYSSFYRSYKKLMGCSPKEDVNHIYIEL